MTVSQKVISVLKMKTREEYNQEMQKLSNRLGHWPKIKKSALSIIKANGEGYNFENCKEEHKKILKRYETLKPIREKVKELKAERDQLFPNLVKKSKMPKYLKVVRNTSDSLILQIGERHLEVNKIHLEGFKRVVYQIPEEVGKNLQKYGIDRTGQDLNSRFFGSGGFRKEVQSAHFIRRK